MILFLGSGVSIASGLPEMAKINSEIINIKDDERLLCFLKTLLELDTNYLEISAPFKDQTGGFGYTGQIFRDRTTYEDLYYLAGQIIANGRGLAADVTAEAFTDFARKKSRTFLRGKTVAAQAVDLYDLAKQAQGYIERKIFTMLQAKYDIGLDLVVELASSPIIGTLYIVTLNHDTLVEQLLMMNDIQYTDGFGRPDGDVRWFNDNYSEDNKVRLIKPHGSISWWRQGDDDVMQPLNILEIEPNNWRDEEGDVINYSGQIPSFLTGVGKVFSYNQGIFADQHYRFLEALRANDLMIMSGYGWGDIPINFQLQSWLARNKKNTLLLLHRDPQSLSENSLELRVIYDSYTRSKRIVPLAKWLSETSIDDIRDFLL